MRTGIQGELHLLKKLHKESKKRLGLFEPLKGGREDFNERQKRRRFKLG